MAVVDDVRVWERSLTIEEIDAAFFDRVATLPRGTAETELFARIMLHELERNSHKGDWLTGDMREHLQELDYHVAKLKAAARAEDLRRVVEFTADVANHAMFILDDHDLLTEHALYTRMNERRYVAMRPKAWRSFILRTPHHGLPKLWRVIKGKLHR